MALDDAILEIRVLGAPHISWQGKEFTIKPPLAFQALVAVALSPNQELSRSALAQQLFGHLQPSSRGNQARLALRKLRRQLEAVGLDNILIWSESTLKIAPKCESDIDAAYHDQSIALGDLPEFARPILEGCNTRFADEVRRRVKNWLESQVPVIFTSLTDASEVRRFSRSLSDIRSNYPHSALITAYLCAALRQMHLAEEYTRAVVSFDSDWLDEFGASDRPDIPAMVEAILEKHYRKSGPVSHPQTEPSSPTRKRVPK